MSRVPTKVLLKACLCLLCVGWLAGCGAAEPGSGLPGAASSGGAPKTTIAEAALKTIAFERTEGSDWPEFLGPDRDSKSSESGLITDWPESGPRIVWQRELGEGYGIGSVSNGRFFQFDRYQDVARLTCLHAETGEELWRFEYPTSYVDLYGYNGGPRCSPVVDGDHVYIYGVEGKLHCLHVPDGELIWEVDTFQKFGVVQNFFGVASTPVIAGDLLISMVGGSPPESQKIAPGQLDRVVGNGSGIVAFDKRTGKVVYQTSDELASYASLKLATIDGRSWCFAFARGGLLGFDPSNGMIDFHYPWRAGILESVNGSTPVVVGDEVFISETYGPGASLLRVAPGGCEVVWKDDVRRREKAMQAHWMTPVYHEGYLYGSSGRNAYDAELRCIDWKTGDVQWSVPELARSSLLYVDKHLICLTEYGRLLLLKANPAKFELLEDVTLREPASDTTVLGIDPAPLLKSPCWAAPILAHGLLYVRGDDRLVCLEVIPASTPPAASQ